MEARFFLLTVFLIGTSLLFGQAIPKTDSETHIFWQFDKELKATDFRADVTKIPRAEKYCDTIGLCTVASIGVFAVMDVPKKKKLRGKLREKIYIAPAFEYGTSYRVKNDSLGIEKQQIVFDICELSARWMRKELAEMVNKMDAYGTLALWFKTLESDAKKTRDTMIDDFTKDVFLFRRKGAYKEWKENIEKELQALEQFATKPEDCYRFVTEKPLDENYEMAENIIGKLFD